MRIPLLTARIRTDQPVRGVPALIRGFLGCRQPENVLLHQHISDGTSVRLVQLYPRVQYRIRDGIPLVTGIAEGVPAVTHATRGLDVLELAGWRYRVLGVDYEEAEVDLEEQPHPSCYTFASPWLALNQDNYARYQAATRTERQQLLGRILIGNILSLCKSFDLIVVQRLAATIDLRPAPVHVKKQTLMGFRGAFSVNFKLGPGLGIGHLTSVGFGEVIEVNSR